MSKIVGYLIIAFGIVTMLSGCFGSINTGNVGVRTSFNKKVDMDELPAGFYIAITDSVEEFNGKEIEVRFDNLTPKAKDNLSLSDLDVSVYYNFDTAKVAEFITKHSNMSVFDEELRIFHPGYKLLTSVGRGVIYDAASKHESLTFHTKRDEIEKDILASLQKELNEKVPNTFSINNVVVRQALTDPALEASIRSAVQMQKQVEAKLHEKELAIAEADRKLQEAQGIKNYNDMITKSITPELLEFKRIEALKEFAKEGTHTIVLPSDTKSMINIGK